MAHAMCVGHLRGPVDADYPLALREVAAISIDRNDLLPVAGQSCDGSQRPWMIGVAMSDDAHFGRSDGLDRGRFRRQIGGTQPGGAGKPPT